MRPPRIGIFLRGARLTVVALPGRDRLTHVVVEAAEDPAATLAGELRSRGLGGGRLRVGLDRRVAVVKALELPPAAGGDLARMVGFDLERHVPFRPEQTRFDWLELPGRAQGPPPGREVAAEARAAGRPAALVGGASVPARPRFG